MEGWVAASPWGGQPGRAGLLRALRPEYSADDSMGQKNHPRARHFCVTLLLLCSQPDLRFDPHGRSTKSGEYSLWALSKPCTAVSTRFGANSPSGGVLRMSDSES